MNNVANQIAQTDFTANVSNETLSLASFIFDNPL
jgi:hypothetical protein